MKTLANRKQDSFIVSNCYFGVQHIKQYLVRFPLESDEKFKWRQNEFVSRFTNHVASAIGGTADVCLKRLPVIEDEELEQLVKLSAEVISRSCKDRICYLYVDSIDNNPFITVVGLTDVVSLSKNLDGSVRELVFEETKSTKANLSGMIQQNDYRVRRHVYEGGGKIVYQNTINKEDAQEKEWVTSFDRCPIVEIDIGTADKHPFYDLAMLNLYLYNLQSDHRNILHLIGSPYVQFFGQVGDGDIKIGADQAFKFRDKSSEGIEITEARGDGVQHIEIEVERTQETLTRMAASVISSTNYSTATQAEANNNNSTGFVKFVAISMQQAFNDAISIMELYKGDSYRGGIVFNTRFEIADFDAAKLGYVSGMFDRGALTKKTMLNIAKTANIVSNSLDVDEEIRLAMGESEIL